MLYLLPKIVFCICRVSFCMWGMYCFIAFHSCELVFWQVLEGLLMLNNELTVQIDAHDTLWGETGTCFFSLCYFCAPLRL